MAEGSPVDIPTDWDPQANQQPTGLLVALPLMRQSRLVRAPLGTPPNKKIRRCKASADFLVGCPVGLEPTVSRSTIWRVNRLRYGHHIDAPEGTRTPAHCLEGSCSIHLSYGRTLLSQWVPLWRQRCVGTGCERNNTIPIAFCQGKSEKSFNFFALRAKMAVPACRNGLTAATFRHSPAQSPVQSRTPRPAHDAPR